MKKELKKFIFGALVVSLATTAGYLIAPIEVRFIGTLTNNTTLIGATYAIGSLFFAFLSVWLGRLSDKIGRNKFLILGCALGIIYPLLYASSYNIFQYMGVKLAWAFSAVTTGPIFLAYLQDSLKKLKKKGQYKGIMYSVQSATGAGASFLGGYLSDHYGLKAPYLVMPLIFILATVISFRTIKLKTKKPLAIPEKRHLFFGFEYLFKKPTLLFYFIHNTAFSINWGIKIMLWPLIIFGMSGQDSITGSIFATMGIVAFVLLLFVGKFIDKTNPLLTTNISISLLGITGLFLVFTRNIHIFWIAAAVYAIGESLYGPSQAVILTENIKSKHRGEVLGVDMVLDNFFITLSPLLAGILLTIWTPQNVLFVYILAFWLSLIMANTLKKHNLEKISQ